jgi:hypothetical protein
MVKEKELVARHRTWILRILPLNTNCLLESRTIQAALVPLVRLHYILVRERRLIPDSGLGRALPMFQQSCDRRLSLRKRLLQNKIKSSSV